MNPLHDNSLSLGPQSHHSRFFWNWATWIVHHRIWAMGFTLFLILSSLFLIVPDSSLSPSLAQFRFQVLGHSGLMVDTSVEAFTNPEEDSQKILERYRDDFGRDDFFMVMVEGDVFSIPFLKRLKQLHERLENLDLEVKSLGERKADRLLKTRHQKVVDQLRTHPSSRQGTDSKQGTEIESQDTFGDDDSFDEDEGWGDEVGGTVIEEVNSLINARHTYASPEMGLIVGEWCDPFPTVDTLATFKQQVLSDESLVGNVVGDQGRHAVISLRANFMSEDDSIKVNQAIEDLTREFNQPQKGFKIYMGGLPQLNTTLKTTLLATLRVLLMLSILLMLCVLTFQFRHPIAIIPPMIVVGMSALNTFGMMSLFGMPVTMLSNILPAFIFCVGIGDSVHLLSVYRDHFKDHQDSKRAVIETVATTGMPVLFTSITTIVGLLSFRFASIPAIQEMGTAGAFGVAAACLHSLIFLPVVLTWNTKSFLGLKKDSSLKKADWLDRFIDFCADSYAGLDQELQPQAETPTQRKRRIFTLWSCAALTLVAILGITRLGVWHNPLSWLPQGHPTKMAFDTMDTHVGGTANVQFLIQGGPKGMKDLEFLKGLDQFEKYLKNYIHPTEGKIVGNTINLNDIIFETRQALKGGNPKEGRLPDTEEELAQVLFLFENTGPDELRRMATNDLSRSQMTLRLKWLEATSYLPFTDYIDQGIKQYIPPHVKVEPTGAVYTLVSTIGALLLDLIRSFGAALFVITLIMIFLLKGLKLGLISMVPNLIPIIWLMGFMGFMGIPVDMNNILIASIAIGLAVDDTIHLLHHYRVQYDTVQDPYLAINHALTHAGRAMLSTSFILTLGFFAYMAAEMQNIRVFGMLIGMSAALAMLIDLIFTPAIVRTFYPRKMELNV